MEHKKLNRIIGVSVFLISLIAYIRTVSPTVVFWDVGEFCAAAFSLQVPHPPGAPLFLLVARMFAMIPFVEDVAVRMHMISALASAMSCMFVYLITVRLITDWRGVPAAVYDKAIVYGSAFVGALSLTFSKTFWFNAVEAEVYGLSMLFVGVIMWLSLRWYDRAGWERSDVYLLFIAYLIGLSVGVHLLAILTLYGVMLIVYFRLHEVKLPSFLFSMVFGVFALGTGLVILLSIVQGASPADGSLSEMSKILPTLFGALIVLGVMYFTFAKNLFNKSAFWFGIVSLLVFGTVYPGIVKEFPSLMDGEFQGKRLEIFSLIPFLAVGGALAGIWYSTKQKRRIWNVSLLAFLFIVLGYSTYLMVYIRANAQPPMNENDPSTITRLVSYLNREQYGSAPLIQRRWDNDPEKRAIAQQYASDWDYLLRYQLNHMYVRYFAWNYIGSEGDWKDAGIDWKKLYGIPFFLGLAGVWFQYKKSPNMWLVTTVMFILMGVVLALYQNQQNPQPRERDYFYVGSFMIFSIWIGIGLVGVVDSVKEKFFAEKNTPLASYGVLALAFVLVPVNMARVNFREADRKGNFVAWDYSYNLLQSCEPDAILFTNGDNDTFPLWYLQDVEGIRRDIRIVNLSLLNTNWYIKQLKNEEPYGAKKVPISLGNDAIDNLNVTRYEPRTVELSVPDDVIQQYSVEGTKVALDTSITKRGVLSFYMPHTMEFQNIKALRVQDIMVYDIVRTSNWRRPVYFAMTVSRDGMIGLHEYLEMEGLALKLTLKKGVDIWQTLNEPKLHSHLFTDVAQPSKTWQPGFLWRGLRDSTTYFDEDVRRLMTNYRSIFLSLAVYYTNVANQPRDAARALDRMEEIMPRHVHPVDYFTKVRFAAMYNLAGDADRSRQISQEVAAELKQVVDRGVNEPISQTNPYILLFFTYLDLGKYDEAENLLSVMKTAYSQQGIDPVIAQLRAQIQGRKASANAPSAPSDTKKAEKGK
ncbi:MAG: DUF2723 domain-containing protein [Ignavibacteriales bacterium]|nr:DUF2723 domain-containing protein [Ignavibacteriales bacterium]